MKQTCCSLDHYIHVLMQKLLNNYLRMTGMECENNIKIDMEIGLCEVDWSDIINSSIHCLC